MKAFLMYRDRDFDLRAASCRRNEADLTQDLELDTLLDAMAGGDAFLFATWPSGPSCRASTDPEAILYRQEVLRDCLEQPAVVREIYALAVEAIEAREAALSRRRSQLPRHDPAAARSACWSCSSRSLKRLRDDRRRARRRTFASEGFVAVLRDARRRARRRLLRDGRGPPAASCTFRRGVLVSAELGKGNRGIDLRPAPAARAAADWLERLSAQDRAALHLHASADRDEAGARALSELQRPRASTSSPTRSPSRPTTSCSFFTMLRTELAFYLGCLNLHERLAENGRADLLPRAASRRRRSAASPARALRRLPGPELEAARRRQRRRRRRQSRWS